MLIGFLIMAAGGLLCMLAGILLAFKHKMSLLHDYHTEHVRQKHTRVYCLMVGIGMLLIGVGISVTAAAAFVFRTEWRWIPAAAGVISGLVLILTAQLIFNRK